MKHTRIMLVGDSTYEIYVKAFYNAFKKLGYQNVELFATNTFFYKGKNKIADILSRVQNKYVWGNRICKIQSELLARVDEFKPDMVFVYSSRQIWPSTIKKIKDKQITVYMYNNDNPFAKYYPKYFWRYYRKALKYADIGFVYREENRNDYMSAGCKKVELLRSYYIEDRNYYMEQSSVEAPEVVFIGHYENDFRIQYMQKMLDNKIEIGVPNTNWKNFWEDNPYFIKLSDCMTKYNEYINAAQIAIVFLSTLNKDTYTRRCFEIPATKTFMLSQYTDDIATMFEEDKEIVFFRNADELVDKIKYYLQHPDERENIAEAGYARLMKDGHEVCDRIIQIMNLYEDKKTGYEKAK